MRARPSASALVLLLAAAGPIRVLAQEQPTRWQAAGPATARLADRAREASAAGDGPGLAAVASSPEEDPVRVVFELHARFVRAALADPAGGRAELEAARALAAASVPRRASPALAEACGSWAAAPKEDLEREARLLAVLPVVAAARAKGGPAAVVEAVEAADGDIRAATRSPAAAVLVHDRADALAEIPRLREAVAAFQDALDRDTALGWLRGRGLALRWSASTLADAGGLESARRMQEGEIRQWTEMDQPLDAWGGRVNRGVLLARSGHLLEARDALVACVAEADGFNLPRARAFARGQLASFYMRVGRVAEARALNLEARGLFLQSGMPGPAMACSMAIAGCDAAEGRFAEALGAIDRGAAMAEGFGNRLASARIQSLRARVYRLLGDRDRACEASAAAEARFRSMGAALDEARAALEHAGTLGEAGRWLEATACAARAMEIAETSGSGDVLRPALLSLAQAHMGQGEFDRAAQELLRVREMAREAGDPLVAARALISLALCRARSGATAEALASLAQAGPECEALVDRALAVRRGLAGAEIALRAGDPAAAAAAARSAQEGLFAMERGLGDEEASGLLARGREAVDAGMEACLRRGPGAATEALAFLEGGRAVLLARILQGRRAILGSRIPGELADARRTASLRLGEASAHLAEAVGLRREEAVAAARTAFDEAEAEWRGLCARTQREARRAAAAAEPPPVDAERIRAAVPEDSALVLFHLGLPVAGKAGRAAAVVLRREGAPVLVDLGESLPLGERAAAWIRHVSTEGGDEEGLATAMYDALLRPLEPALAGARRILVSPDGALHFLPFEALLRREGDRRERAVERWEFAFVPSGSVLADLAEEARGRERGQGLLALADPLLPSEMPAPRGTRAAKGAGPLQDLGGLRRLGESGEEVRAVSADFPPASSVLLLRGGATRAALETALRAAKGRLAAVHLACHGVLDPEHPALTGLVLSGGEVLSLYDVYEIPIPADLAVLSGCRTAGGPLVSGEGVLGLVRGFFFAGCPRVVASSWEVPDRGTRVFMEEFYRGWRRDGLAPAAALRAAKLTALRRGGPDAHPSRWAAFVLWGLPD